MRTIQESARGTTRSVSLRTVLSGVAVWATTPASVDFYRDGLLVAGDSGAATNTTRPLIALESSPVRPALNGGAFGLTYPTPAALATVVAAFGINAPHTLIGGNRTVHLDVFVFSAPDGATVELSAPTAGGHAGALDADEYLGRHMTSAGRTALATGDAHKSLPAPELVHASLRVADLRATANFYAEIFGFRVVTGLASMMVLESGRQRLVLHGAQKGVVGLAGLTFTVGTQHDLETMAWRLTSAGHAIEVDESLIRCVDPGGTRLTITKTE